MEKVVKNVPLEERAYLAIKKMIIDGELEADQPVPESMLATSLGISRSPVKAALTRLIQEGFIVAEAWKIPHVASFSHKYIDDVYQLHKALDTQRANETIHHLPNSDVDTFAGILEGINPDVSASVAEQIRAAYRHFQDMLKRHCDNDLLNIMIEKLDGHLQRIRRTVDGISDQEFLIQEYWMLKQELEAIRVRDGSRLVRLLADHHDAWRQWLMANWIPSSATTPLDVTDNNAGAKATLQG